jgi:hypothetical protein
MRSQTDRERIVIGALADAPLLVRALADGWDDHLTAATGKAVFRGASRSRLRTFCAS